MGISGGEEGARNGPSLMPGGPREAFDALEPIITKCAAQISSTITDKDNKAITDVSACTTYLGSIGSGNYVKMIHNGIEYGDMQLIAESYDVLKQIVGLSNEEIAAIFAEWNTGELESYLIEITSIIFTRKDDLDSDNGDAYIVDKILDKTGMKGTGRWTVQEGAERNTPLGTIAASLDARYLSGRKEQRVEASKILEGPSYPPQVDKNQIVADLKEALYCSKICSYAQGMNLIKATSEEYEWGVDLGECARIWKGGCIIRAGFLDRIRSAYHRNPDLMNLVCDPSFAEELNMKQGSWRRIVSLCIASGIACPSFSASLCYFDSYRRATLPANLTQAQRDFFGGHTYERNDRPGTFHFTWTDAHKDIGDIGARTMGELAGKK